MSRSFSASQYDKSYNPLSLSNWEVPDRTKAVKSPTGGSPAHKTADGRTVPIVDAQGHIVKGAKKAAAFVQQPARSSGARWPQPDVTTKNAGAATMGYKGIQTSFLPASTVPLKSVEVEGCKEANFNSIPH